MFGLFIGLTSLFIIFCPVMFMFSSNITMPSQLLHLMSAGPCKHGRSECQPADSTALGCGKTAHTDCQSMYQSTVIGCPLLTLDLYYSKVFGEDGNVQPAVC